jgi:hypothetical protein
MRRLCFTAGALVLGVFAAACGADTSANSFGGPTSHDAGQGQPSPTPPPTDAGARPDAPPPPEKEVEGDYQSPVATGQFVWIANPTSGRVAYIRASTLDVRTVEAGNQPTYLAAVPHPTDDVAIVMNLLSRDATLLRATGQTLTTRSFKIGATANAWAVSDDGRWAVAWSDSRKLPKADKTEGFQDLTVIDLHEQRPVTTLAVGYRPVAIAFSKTGGFAYAVTQDGISVVDLAGGSTPTVVKNVPISDDPLEDPGTRDVSITPDGKLALIRREGKSDLSVVSLETGTRTPVQLAGAVTDLDISTDGTRAVAVVREQGIVSVLPIPAIATNPTGFTSLNVTGQTVGSVSIAQGGETALLYSNAVVSERLAVMSLDPLASRAIRLYSPVLAVFPTPDARHAVVVHPNAGAKGAFSLVPVAADLPAKIVGTTAQPNAVALAPSSDRAIVTVRDDTTKSYGAYLAKLPALEVQQYTLASPPIAAGVVAGARRAFVAQQHREGRITFIDLISGEARTLTGFELGARVVDGSRP